MDPKVVDMIIVIYNLSRQSTSPHPTEVHCENRELSHVVDWTTDYTICNKHRDALPYSHPLMCVKMLLIWMQKKLQKSSKLLILNP